VNPAAAGKTYRATTLTVDPQRVAAFREVFDESEGVPATFVTVAEFAVMPQIVADPELGLDFSRVLHGNQEYEYRCRRARHWRFDAGSDRSGCSAATRSSCS